MCGDFGFAPAIAIWSATFTWSGLFHHTSDKHTHVRSYARTIVLCLHLATYVAEVSFCCCNFGINRHVNFFPLHCLHNLIKWTVNFRGEDVLHSATCDQGHGHCRIQHRQLARLVTACKCAIRLILKRIATELMEQRVALSRLQKAYTYSQ